MWLQEIGRKHQIRFSGNYPEESSVEEQATVEAPHLVFVLLHLKYGFLHEQTVVPHHFVGCIFDMK